MKKNDWILLTGVGFYTFLFYQQNAGINFLLFSMALITLMGIKDHTLIKSKPWCLSATGVILSALCITLYGNSLSVTANVISLSLLSGISINNRSSIIFSLLFAFYSYFSSPVYIFLDWTERRLKTLDTGSSNVFKKVWVIIIPFIITLIFFLMYRASNALFNDFAKNINLDFVSWSWITFTLGGFFLLYGFFYHRQIRSLAELDENSSNELGNEKTQPLLIFGKTIPLNDEVLSGTTLFILLNLLLLIVNSLDINLLFLGGNLPSGITYSEFVHQGAGMLITSILVAIAIILFYFRGSLNFYEKNKTIKYLAILWIAQNAFMLVSTAVRNNMYIGEYGITYKRIGVYVYLLLSLIGLITTYIKIHKVKSNYFLFRANAWLFYATLIISCFFNWDKVITNYNIRSTKLLDKKYLIELSNTNLPELFQIQSDSSTAKQNFDNAREYLENYDDSSKASAEKKYFNKRLGSRFYNFLLDRQNQDWRSWKYDNTRVYEELMGNDVNSKIKFLNLSEKEINSLEPLKGFTNIQGIVLSSNKISNMREFKSFSSLQYLDLSKNNISILNGIETLNKLEYLNLNDNAVINYAPLYSLKQLKELHIDFSCAQYKYDLLKQNLPNTKIIIGETIKLL